MEPRGFAEEEAFFSLLRRLRRPGSVLFAVVIVAVLIGQGRGKRVVVK